MYVMEQPAAMLPNSGGGVVPIPLKEWVAFREFEQHIPFGRSEMHRRILAGRFPRGVRLSSRIAIYRRSDIMEFLANPAGYRAAKP